MNKPNKPSKNQRLTNLASSGLCRRSSLQILQPAALAKATLNPPRSGIVNDPG